MRKLLIQLPNLACRAGYAVIYLGNPGVIGLIDQSRRDIRASHRAGGCLGGLQGN